MFKKISFIALTILLVASFSISAFALTPPDDFRFELQGSINKNIISNSFTLNYDQLDVILVEKVFKYATSILPDDSDVRGTAYFEMPMPNFALYTEFEAGIQAGLNDFVGDTFILYFKQTDITNGTKWLLTYWAVQNSETGLTIPIYDRYNVDEFGWVIAPIWYIYFSPGQWWSGVANTEARTVMAMTLFSANIDTGAFNRFWCMFPTVTTTPMPPYVDPEPIDPPSDDPSPGDIVSGFARLWSEITTLLQNILDVPLYGDITIGTIVLIPIAFAILTLFLKYFAGG